MGRLQTIDVDAEDGEIEADQHEHSAKTGMETAGCRCVNQQSNRALVERDKDCSHGDHGQDAQQLVGITTRKCLQVEQNKADPGERGRHPSQRTIVLPQWVHEEPDHEGKPDERHPAMFVIVGIELPPDCLKRGHGLLESLLTSVAIVLRMSWRHNGIPNYGHRRDGQSQQGSMTAQRQSEKHRPLRRPKESIAAVLFACCTPLAVSRQLSAVGQNCFGPGLNCQLTTTTVFTRRFSPRPASNPIPPAPDRAA